MAMVKFLLDLLGWPCPANKHSVCKNKTTNLVEISKNLEVFSLCATGVHPVIKILTIVIFFCVCVLPFIAVRVLCSNSNSIGREIEGENGYKMLPEI